jgi:hypothetical protein
MTTRLLSRRTAFLTLGLAAALAVALGLWAFQAERASANPDDLTVAVTSDPSSGTWAPGTLVSYTVTVGSDFATSATDGIDLNIALANVAQEGGAPPATGGITCTVANVHLLNCQVTNFDAGGGTRTVTFSARTEAAGIAAQVGAALDPDGSPNYGEVEEGVVDGSDDDEDGGATSGLRGWGNTVQTLVRRRGPTTSTASP